MAKAYSRICAMRVVLRQLMREPHGMRRRNASVSASVLRFAASGLRNEGGSKAKFCGGSRSQLEDYAEQILEIVAEQRDRTLDEIVAAMQKATGSGSRTALSISGAPRASRNKKVLHASEQERADVRVHVDAGFASKGLLDTSRLVFLDETSVNTNMTRLTAAAARANG